MLILLGAGGLSRVSLGLSPTNYVSATRTFAVLSISILIMCIPVIKEIIKQKKVALIISFFLLSNKLLSLELSINPNSINTAGALVSLKT